jgi:hypothetical protein
MQILINYQQSPRCTTWHVDVLHLRCSGHRFGPGLCSLEQVIEKPNHVAVRSLGSGQAVALQAAAADPGDGGDASTAGRDDG